MMIGSSRIVVAVLIGLAVITSLNQCVGNQVARAEITTQISAAGDTSLGAETLSPVQPGRDILPLIEEAKKWIAGRQITRAQQSLQPLRIHPEIMDADVLLADLMMASGMHVEGRQLLERAASETPPKLAVYLAFSELAVREQRWFDGWNLVRDGQLIAAPKHWSDELTVRVQQRFIFLDAVCNEKRLAWDQAKRSYESLTGQSQGAMRIESLLGLGRCWFHLKNEPQAITAWTAALSEGKDFTSPYQLLADSFEQQGSFAQSEQAYRTGLKQSHGITAESLRLSLTRQLLQRNQVDQAKLVLSGQPATPATKPLAELAPLAEPATDALDVSGQDRERESASRLASQRVLLEAVIARLEQRLSDAQILLTKLHRQEPSSDAVCNHLAVVLVESEDEATRGRALQIAESSVRNRQQSADAWATLGWVQLSLGDIVAAEASLGNALRLGPISRDTLYYMAQLKKAKGDNEQSDQLMMRYDQAAGPRFFQ